MAALRRLDRIRAVGVGAVPAQDLPEARLARLARHAQLAWTQPLGRLSEDRRHATLLVFVQTRRQAAQGLVNMGWSQRRACALTGSAVAATTQ